MTWTHTTTFKYAMFYYDCLLVMVLSMTIKHGTCRFRSNRVIKEIILPFQMMVMLNGVSVFVLIFSVVYCQVIRDRRPTVQLPQGTLVGVKVYTDSGRIVDAFLGIPFAASPVGPLRFAPPQRHQGWNGTYQASEYKPPCPQLPLKRGVIYIEDCLYLNVWTPENVARFGPLPVVILFEGIEFTNSNSIPIPGQDFSTENVVVVTVNYRLNVFGFLCLETQEVRGNFGILDQYFSMLWVRENIKFFGGDVDKITLFGHAAGAASVILHMVSPRTAGLFQKVIISTGSAVSPWHFSGDVTIASQKIARILGCIQESSKIMLKCLLSKTTKDILHAYEEYTLSSNSPQLFLPVVDLFLKENDQYLPVEPGKALREGYFPQVPILTGISRPLSDPQYKTWTELASQGFIQLQQFIEHTKLEEIMTRYDLDTDKKGLIGDIIKWKYQLSNHLDAKKLLENLKQLDFDARIEAPHFLQLNYLSSYVQPIYVYYMEDMGFQINVNDSLLTSDLLLVFGPLLLNQVARRRFQTNELRFSKHIKQLWTNFIIFGNPTPSNLNTWNSYKPNNYHIESLGTRVMGEESSKILQRVAFWNQLLAKIAYARNSNASNILELQHSPDPSAGFRHAMYTLIGLVIALLGLLLICIVLLKKHSKERDRHIHIGF